MMHLHRHLPVAALSVGLALAPDMTRAQDTTPPAAPKDSSGDASPSDEGELLDLSDQRITAEEPAPPASAAPLSPASAPLPAPSAPAVTTPPFARALEATSEPRVLRTNAIQLSVLGLLGRFRLNYELFVSPQHGLVLEGILWPNLLDRLSEDTDDGSDPRRFFGYGAGAGYRWHWRGEEGGFLSAMVALEHGSGSLPVFADPDIRWSGTLTTLSITPAAGRRWLWESGFSMVLRGGIGYAQQWVESDPELDEDAEDQYERPFGLNIEGELSFGYSF